MLLPYLAGTRFTIQVNQDGFKCILTMAHATGKLTQWRLRLSELALDVVHRSGMKHQAADALSHLDYTAPDTFWLN